MMPPSPSPMTRTTAGAAACLAVDAPLLLLLSTDARMPPRPRGLGHWWARGLPLLLMSPHDEEADEEDEKKAAATCRRAARAPPPTPPTQLLLLLLYTDGRTVVGRKAAPAPFPGRLDAAARARAPRRGAAWRTRQSRAIEAAAARNGWTGALVPFIATFCTVGAPRSLSTNTRGRRSKARASAKPSK